MNKINDEISDEKYSKQMLRTNTFSDKRKCCHHNLSERALLTSASSQTIEAPDGYRRAIQVLRCTESRLMEDNMDSLKTIKADSPLNLVQQRQFVTEHSTCAMCDSKLEISHEINRQDLKIKEEAHCPSCGIRVRSTHHLMH